MEPKGKRRRTDRDKKEGEMAGKGDKNKSDNWGLRLSRIRVSKIISTTTQQIREIDGENESSLVNKKSDGMKKKIL